MMGGMGMGGMGGMGGYGLGGFGGMGGMMGGFGGIMPAYGAGGNIAGYAPQFGVGYPGAGSAPPLAAVAGTGTTPSGTGDQTGAFLQTQAAVYENIPRVIPNPLDNSLMIQARPQDYQQILKLLKQVDIPPRQVLIDAKIYEVSLTGAFASGVSYALQQKGTSQTGRQFLAGFADGFTRLSAGWLASRSRELMAFLSLAENQSKTKVISSPSVIATDSIAASINVGIEVPTLTAQAVSPVQSAGSSLFANTIQSRNTGVQLNIMARVNPSGVTTLFINQEVSSPQPPAAGSIQSPSFSRRAVNTQVTVEDGDTIAIGGIITESNTSSSAGIPFLHKLPVVGNLFGSKSTNEERTEMIIFMTPRVIYDTNHMAEASDELRSRLKRLNKIIKDE